MAFLMLTGPVFGQNDDVYQQLAIAGSNAHQSILYEKVFRKHPNVLSNWNLVYACYTPVIKWNPSFPKISECTRFASYPEWTMTFEPDQKWLPGEERSFAPFFLKYETNDPTRNFEGEEFMYKWVNEGWNDTIRLFTINRGFDIRVDFTKIAGLEEGDGSFEWRCRVPHAHPHLLVCTTSTFNLEETSDPANDLARRYITVVFDSAPTG